MISFNSLGIENKTFQQISHVKWVCWTQNSFLCTRERFLFKKSGPRLLPSLEEIKNILKTFFRELRSLGSRNNEAINYGKILMAKMQMDA